MTLAPHRIFLSHSSKDHEFCVRLVDDLRLRLGGEDAVWYDARGGLHGGDAWWRKIEQELTTRTIFLVVLSPDAIDSPWVNTEIDIAWNRRHHREPAQRMQIIPLLYRPCTIRASLETLQVVSFLSPKTYGEALQEVLIALGLPTPERTTPSQPTSAPGGANVYPQPAYGQPATQQPPANSWAAASQDPPANSSYGPPLMNVVNKPPVLASLSFLTGPLAGLTVPISKPLTSLGRDETDNDIVIADPDVSRHHARIVTNGAQWMIEKLAPQNTVTVNSREVGQAPLADRDTIGLGTSTTFLLQIASPIAPFQPAPYREEEVQQQSPFCGQCGAPTRLGDTSCPNCGNWLPSDRSENLAFQNRMSGGKRKDLVGQTLGQYHLESLLGTGGMGQVYRSVHKLLKRPAAVKVMLPNFAVNPQFRAHFLQEARAAATLRHPNIVEIYEFGAQDGVLFLVMELLTDGALSTLLRQKSGQPLPLPQALDLGSQIAEGLAAAHSMQVIHRDIRPANLLLSRLTGAVPGREQYTVKISDFGLANSPSLREDEDDILPITLAYLSPEQCMGSRVDARSDLYSLGLVLYEMTTGYYPFQITSIVDALYKHTSTPPPSPHDIRPDLPPVIEEIILRCLAKKPEERFSSGTALSTALQSVLGFLDNSGRAPKQNRYCGQCGMEIHPGVLTLNHSGEVSCSRCLNTTFFSS